MIRSILKIMNLIDEYQRYLVNRGIVFNEDGFLLLDRNCFLVEKPDLVVTYSHRHSRLVADPSRTVIWFFESDARNYARVENVVDDLNEYRGFLGVCAPDVTVTVGMDSEWQAMIMLLNYLVMGVIAVNGLNVLANLRCGGDGSLRYLSAIPKDVGRITSTLGCAGFGDGSNVSFLQKVMLVRPSPLILYGKRDAVMIRQ